MVERSPGSVSDVVVLGAGIIGVCCALSLQQKGLSVTLIDRGEPGDSTSYGNAGVISPWSSVPQCMPGIWKQVPGWLLDPKGPVRARFVDLPMTIPWAIKFLLNTRQERVCQISNAMDMLVRGNVMAYKGYLKGTGHESLMIDSWHVNAFRGKAKANLEDFGWQLKIRHGATAEKIDGKELREIEPAVSPEYHSAIIIKDQARAYAPGEICKVLFEKAMHQGATFLQQSITNIVPEAEGYTLVSDAGKISAKKLVMCAGIWSTELLKPLGIKLPLIPERGYHLEFGDPGISINNSILDVAGKFIVSSMAGGVRAAGTAEFTSIDAPPNYQRAQILNPLAKRLLPDLNLSHSKQWMGIRPSFPDNLPAIGEIKGLNGLYAAFGHSHYGLSMGPATARIIADEISGGTYFHKNREAVSVDRFL